MSLRSELSMNTDIAKVVFVAAVLVLITVVITLTQKRRQALKDYCNKYEKV